MYAYKSQRRTIYTDYSLQKSLEENRVIVLNDFVVNTKEDR